MRVVFIIFRINIKKCRCLSTFSFVFPEFFLYIIFSAPDSFAFIVIMTVSFYNLPFNSFRRIVLYVKWQLQLIR